MLLSNYSEIIKLPEAPSTFKNNIDPKGRSILDTKPSYYRFSFYDILSETLVPSSTEYEDWIKNSSLTVIHYFY